jgi:putative ABC transport system permease protein
MTPEEMLNAYEVRLDSATIISFYGAMLAIILLSILIPVLYIARLDPKKILM